MQEKPFKLSKKNNYNWENDFGCNVVCTEMVYIKKCNMLLLVVASFEWHWGKEKGILRVNKTL